jgi:GMP reductase
MHIINEPQLDFSDVLIRPKRSELASRKDVDLYRTIKGKWNPDFQMTEITPIMLSNMDNITTWEMVDKFLEQNCMVAMNKFVAEKEWIEKIEVAKKFHAKCNEIHLDSSKNITEELNKMDESEASSIDCHLSNGNLAYTIGIRKDEWGDYVELDRFRSLKKRYPSDFMHLMIDVPNGYSQAFADFVEMVQELILRGADCVKVGIGNGNACLTRIKSGVGRPQLSTIIECADAAHQSDGYIISDGGCKNAGDVCKAFCAGADFVMLGSMFAGHDECDGDVVTKYEVAHLEKLEETEMGYNTIYSHIDGVSGINQYEELEKKYKEPAMIHTITRYEPQYKEKKFKEFWGMSSKKAMEKHYGKMYGYRSSEGRELLVPYKGPVQNTLNDILGGLRSMCTYIGAKQIKHVPKCATFYLVNRQVSNMFND